MKLTNVNRFTNDSMSTVLTVGACWGIFEATLGYVLHLLPINIGFLVWYPVAVFFLTTSYRLTKQRWAVVATALLAAAIKLFNLMLPGRIDRVINPAISIAFEGIIIGFAILLLADAQQKKKNMALFLISIAMNSMWRLCYLGYLAILVPDWMREASVLQSNAKLIRFLFIDNLCSSLVVWGSMMVARKFRFSPKVPILPWKNNKTKSTLMPFALLALNIVLQLVL